jgi:hypothetical protein
MQKQILPAHEPRFVTHMHVGAPSLAQQFSKRPSGYLSPSTRCQKRPSISVKRDLVSVSKETSGYLSPSTRCQKRPSISVKRDLVSVSKETSGYLSPSTRLFLLFALLLCANTKTTRTRCSDLYWCLVKVPTQIHKTKYVLYWYFRSVPTAFFLSLNPKP